MGFTIIEMVLYASLLSVFLLILVGVFTSILDVRLESQASSSVQQDGRFLLARLEYDVRRASSIVLPLLGATSSSLQITIDGVNYTYAFTNGAMNITNANGTDTLNSAGSVVQSLLFTRVGTGGKDTIRVLLTIVSTTVRPGGAEVRNFQTTVGLR